MASTKTRSFTKALTWELSGLLVLLAMTRNITISTSYTLIRIIMFYTHERLWKLIRWGKKQQIFYPKRKVDKLLKPILTIIDAVAIKKEGPDIVITIKI